MSNPVANTVVIEVQSHVHPAFCTVVAEPVPGLRLDANFGQEMGDERRPPLPEAPRLPVRDDESNSNSELPEDPIREFNRRTSPARMEPASAATLVRALLHTGESTMEFAQHLFAARESDQWNIQVVMFIEIICMLHARAPEPVLALNPAAGPPIVHVFGIPFKNFCRSKIREILTTGNVESYTTTVDTHGHPIGRTPLILLQTHIDAQEAAFHRDYLPPGYPDDPHAQLCVVAVMRSLLKHDRGQLRNLLLTNIIELNRRPIGGPVPRLFDLIVLIDHNMGSRNRLRSTDSIRLAYNGTTKIRLAFLRLAIAHKVLHHDPRNPMTTWEIIDCKLQALATRPRVFQYAFAELVIQTDERLFDGIQHMLAIDPDAIRLPLDAEVEVRVIEEH